MTIGGAKGGVVGAVPPLAGIVTLVPYLIFPASRQKGDIHHGHE